MRQRHDWGHEPLFERFARRLTADGDPAPAGGAPAPAADAPPPADGGAAPDAGGAAPAAAPAQPKSLLTDAKAPEGDDPAKVEPPKVEETPEQKAERLKNETPEQKEAREKQEAEDAEKAKAARTEALKPYDALKLPEGMPADQPAFVDFKNAALDLGVEPEKAQKLIDTVAPKLQEAVDAPYKAWADTQEEWIKTCQNDPEIGGANFEKNLGFAARVIDTFGAGEKGSDLRKAFAFTGAGSNPEIMRTFIRIGKAMAEGGPVLGKPAPAPKSLAAGLYPSMEKSNT